MGTSLDIKIKRANKVYLAGVSGAGGRAGLQGAPLTPASTHLVAGGGVLGGAGGLRLRLAGSTEPPLLQK